MAAPKSPQYTGNPKKHKQDRRERNPLPVTRLMPKPARVCADCSLRPRELGKRCLKCADKRRS